ncbi:MAG: hypothetical protein QF652_08460, partial [Dehalococcoidia bacterium]|nr:hypothetical protein [Dehalococcoidia bacterium]
MNTDWVGAGRLRRARHTRVWGEKPEPELRNARKTRKGKQPRPEALYHRDHGGYNRDQILAKEDGA